jgi:hypothetical protein
MHSQIMSNSGTLTYAWTQRYRRINTHVLKRKFFRYSTPNAKCVILMQKFIGICAVQNSYCRWQERLEFCMCNQLLLYNAS